MRASLVASVLRVGSGVVARGTFAGRSVIRMFAVAVGETLSPSGVEGDDKGLETRHGGDHDAVVQQDRRHDLGI